MPELERLQNVMRVLEDVIKESRPFLLGLWLDEGGCKTTGCAIGWCTQDSWHKSAGLEFDPSTNTVVFWDEVRSMSFSGLSAVSAYLGIPHSDAIELFTPSEGYSTARDVRARLQAYISKISLEIA